MQWFCRFYFPVILLIYFSSCTPRKNNTAGQPIGKNIIVIGIGSDVDTFNPLFAQEVTAGEISELIYPSLVKADFDTAEGSLHYSPMLARTWEFTDNNREIVFHLRSDASWSDGQRITARDVQYSYELYGNEELASVRQHEVEGLKKGKDGTIDIRHSIEIVNDSTVRFHFERSSPSQLHDAGLPILPAHLFDTIPQNELRTHSINRKPVGAGPFSLASRKPNEEIILKSNPLSVLPKPAMIDQLVFRVIPDHGSRFAHLKSGEIDLMTDLSPSEAREVIDANLPIRVIATPPRRYQFIGWNNIDGQAYVMSSGKNIQPHPLFGNKTIRTALTMAVDRKSIVKALLAQFGQEAVGPVSPIFRYAYDDTLNPIPFDPRSALALLKKEGWDDSDNDGVLEKGKTKFSFGLTIPAGSQFTLELATIIQKQLRDVKIAVHIQQVEESIFWQQLVEKKFDAFIGGFEIPLQLQLSMFWGSDLSKYPFNFVSFRDPRVDQILQKAESMRNVKETAHLWKEFQVILAEQQPCTFLFWENNVIGVNKRVAGTNFSILGTTYRSWEWKIE
ncbi:MAG: ABC transporter substrate-binding protein [Bacteroidota bacterium]